MQAAHTITPQQAFCRRPLPPPAAFTLSFTFGAPWPLPALCLLLWLLATASCYRLPLVYQPSSFRVPLFPLSPALGVLINIHLIGSLGLPAYVRFAVWMVLGLLIYAFYGIHAAEEREASQHRWVPGGRVACLPGSTEPRACLARHNSCRLQLVPAPTAPPAQQGSALAGLRWLLKDSFPQAAKPGPTPHPSRHDSSALGDEDGELLEVELPRLHSLEHEGPMPSPTSAGPWTEYELSARDQRAASDRLRLLSGARASDAG